MDCHYPRIFASPLWFGAILCHFIYGRYASSSTIILVRSSWQIESHTPIIFRVTSSCVARDYSGTAHFNCHLAPKKFSLDLGSICVYCLNGLHLPIIRSTASLRLIVSYPMPLPCALSWGILPVFFLSPTLHPGQGVLTWPILWSHRSLCSTPVFHGALTTPFRLGFAPPWTSSHCNRRIFIFQTFFTAASSFVCHTRTRVVQISVHGRAIQVL